jgi:PAS domain S-box-containing protein
MNLETSPGPKFDVLRRQLVLVDAGANFFSDLFERAPEPMIVIDSRGLVLAANAAACRLYAVDQSELVRLRIKDLLPRGIDLRGASRGLRDFGEASLEFTDTGKDGGLTDMRLEGRLFQTGRYLICFHDITREKRFEREAERAYAERTFNAAAATIVHDVNNLLVPIVCYTDLLALREPSDGELHRSVAEIREAAQRAAQLARKLLSIAELRVEKPAPVQMNAMLNRLADMLARLLGGNIELSLHLHPDLPDVDVDQERLERVVFNLVLNARDAMPKGGCLVIETKSMARAVEGSGLGDARPTWVTLSVTDNGVGMDRSTRERIFEPFFTTKSPETGTGLGLSSALSFVQRNQGFIDVESELGRGTTFRIGLPTLVVASGAALAAPVRKSLE